MSDDPQVPDYPEGTPPATPETWARVELMGHVSLAGRMTEEEKFGVKMGRLDVPNQPKPDCLACKGSGKIAANTVGVGELAHRCRMPDCNGFTTIYFGGASVYRITVCTEAVARVLAQKSSPAPVSAWDFPKTAVAALEHRGSDGEEWDDYPGREED